MYTVPSELIAKVRAYIAPLRYLHNEVALIPSKHIKQIKKKKRKKVILNIYSKRAKREPGHAAEILYID